jgi:hypothetical protein
MLKCDDDFKFKNKFDGAISRTLNLSNKIIKRPLPNLLRPSL